jgi:hypothetical protein
MKTRPIGLSIVLIFFVGVLILLIGSTFVLQDLSAYQVDMDEFPINYLAAKNWIIENRSPYDFSNGMHIDSVIGIKNGNHNSNGVAYYRYPFMSILIIMPFTLLTYIKAKSLWMAINCIVLIIGCVLFVLCLRYKYPIGVLIATALFGILNLYGIQNILTANLSILLIVFLLIWGRSHKRRKFVRSFWAGALFQLVISLILLPSWPRGWLYSLIQDINANGTYSSIISQIIVRLYPEGMWLNLGIHLALLLFLIVLWITYRDRVGLSFLWVISMTLLTSSLIVFPSKIGGMISCLPALMLVAYTWMSRWEKYGRTFFGIVVALLIFAPWVILIAGSLGSSSEVNIRLGLIYPIIGFLGLWWIRWWVLKPGFSSETIAGYFDNE